MPFLATWLQYLINGPVQGHLRSYEQYNPAQSSRDIDPILNFQSDLSRSKLILYELSSQDEHDVSLMFYL